MPDARATALANSRLFHAMTPSDAQAILAAGIGRGLRKGQVLIRQAEPAAAFFLIERGYLKLTQVTAEGSEVIVRFAGPWDPVAGVAALGETPYPVTATACDAVDLVVWPRPVLADLLGRYPQLKTNILREMTAHMDDALTRLRELATLKVSQRYPHRLGSGRSCSIVAGPDRSARRRRASRRRRGGSGLKQRLFDPQQRSPGGALLFWTHHEDASRTRDDHHLNACC